MNRRKKKLVSKVEVRIDEALLKRIKTETHDTGTGMSQFIRDAITDKLKKDNEKTL